MMSSYFLLKFKLESLTFLIISELKSTKKIVNRLISRALLSFDISNLLKKLFWHTLGRLKQVYKFEASLGHRVSFGLVWMTK